MTTTLIAAALVLFHIFCSRWMVDWAFDGSGISKEAFQAKCKELEEAEKQQEPNKIRRLFLDPKPTQRALRSRILENAPTLEVFKRRDAINTICSVPPAICAIRMLLGEMNFWGMAPIPAPWYWAWLGYDAVILIVGIVYNRTHK